MSKTVNPFLSGVFALLILLALIGCSGETPNETPIEVPASANTSVADNATTMLERQQAWEKQWVDSLNELLALKKEYETKLAQPPPPVKIIEVPVEKIVIVNKELPMKLADWGDVEQLKHFLEEDDTDTNLVLIADGLGNIELEGYCEDRAIQLMDRAAIVGKRLSFVPIHPEEYQKWYGGEEIEDGVYHAICGALVGSNEFYYVEPSNDKCWLAQYLD